MFTISTTNENGITCVNPDGRIDTLNSVLFNKKLHELLENETFLIINFTNCHYLASSGIRSLIAAAKTLGSKGGELILASLSSEVFQVLEMAGLHALFKLAISTKAAVDEISLRKQAPKSKQIEIGNHIYEYNQSVEKDYPTLFWEKEEIIGYNELLLSIGIGSPAESLVEEDENIGLFIAMGNCCGFLPFDTRISPDFRVLKDPTRGAIFLHWALSLSHSPGIRVKSMNDSGIELGSLLNDMEQFKPAVEDEKLQAILVADANDSVASLSLGFILEKNNPILAQSLLNEQLYRYAQETGNGDQLIIGARFLLNQLPEFAPDESIVDFAKRTLTFENIESIEHLDLSYQLTQPMVWLSYSSYWVNATSKQIKVETSDNFNLEPYKIYLARKLYTDSSKVIVKQLHGGFSAQTFQVDSFDQQGRKLRPTVLKISSYELIAREASRCQEFSLPFIMNNSAMVLGTEFYRDIGALRYNFVGIGGENTQLKWLTHYFNTWEVEELEPLYDKIFLQILKPWYGQPVKEQIFPYRDHDPSFTFFPHIYTTAENELSISADEKYIKIEETGEKRINPYWFLKHGYSSRRNNAIDYYTSICHGDLNMQNILLDKEMNVYLIDFSETRPRSVISDFARLEAIFMIEYAPMDNADDLAAMVHFTTQFYNNDKLDRLSDQQWDGKAPAILKRNLALTSKMRLYARECTRGENTLIPYYIALLEWILPVVCYGGASLLHKKLSAYVAGLLCEKIMESDTD